MWTILLWFILLWVCAGFALFLFLQYDFRQAEKEIERGERHDLIPLLSLIYSMMEADPTVFPLVCIIMWPYIVFSVIFKAFFGG